MTPPRPFVCPDCGASKQTPKAVAIHRAKAHKVAMRLALDDARAMRAGGA